MYSSHPFSSLSATTTYSLDLEHEVNVGLEFVGADVHAFVQAVGYRAANITRRRRRLGDMIVMGIFNS